VYGLYTKKSEDDGQLRKLNKSKFAATKARFPVTTSPFKLSLIGCHHLGRAAGPL